MALFNKKTWQNRLSEYPNRRKLTKENGTTELVTVARSEGTISREGDAFSDTNMNDLESRIQKAIGAGNLPTGLGADIIAAITTLNTGLDDLNSLIGGYDLRFHSEYYTGSSTMTNLLKSLSIPTICLTSTENITDKPTGKYGVIFVFKYSATRAGAICICTDGALMVNAWNASTSAVTGWQTK